MSKFDSFLKDLEGASVLELNELVKAIEEKFGVSAQAVAAAGPAAAGPAAEEKDAFTVVLASAGEQKIAVMKVVKELVDSAPATLKDGMKKAEAEEVKKKIEEAGGKIELK